MDARDSQNNPFENTLSCLEWIASAMDAARRHNEEKSAEEFLERPDRPAVPASQPSE